MELTPLSPKTLIKAGAIIAGPILPEIKLIEENPNLLNKEGSKLEISPSQAQPINFLVVSAINNFEKSIIEFAKKLCGKDFNEIQSAVKDTQQQIILINSIQNPEDYGIEVETIKSLQKLSEDILDHFSDYNDANKEFYQGSYLGLAAIIQITQEIEKLTQLATKINFSNIIAEEQSRETAMQVFIDDPHAIKLEDLPKQEIIDARDAIAGLGTSSLAITRLQASLVSPAGTDLIGEIIGDIKTGDLFINKLMYASDLQGGSSYLTDNLQEFELKYHDDMALRHIQTETPNRRIYVKIPINLDQIKEGETLVLPTKLGYTAIATNAKYVKAMKDSLGLTYIYGLETESLEQDSQGQKYISYVLEGDRYKSIQAPDNLDKWLELPTEKRLLDKYPHLKNVLDLIQNPFERVELIEAFIALQQTYVDDPNLALALSSAPNMLDLQNELGFIGTCGDFAYCTDLMLKEAEIPTIQASGLVAIKNCSQTSFDANQVHVINLVVQSGKIKEKDFTKNAKQKSNDSSADILIQELSTHIQAASHFAKQLGGDIERNFRHICSLPEFNKLGQKIGIENKEIQFTFLTNSWFSIVSGLKDLDYCPPDSVTLKELTNPYFNFDGDFAHAITDLAKANSPLKKLLEDPNRAKELIDFMSKKYAIKSKKEYLLNIFDLSADELQTIIPALKDIEKNNFDTWLSLMVRDTLNRKIYTEAELKVLIEHIETVIELINQETRHNFKLQTAYDNPDSIMCINLAKFSLDQTQITTLLQDLSFNSQVIFFDANGDIDPLSAPNLFLEEYPFDPNSKPMQAAHLGKLVNEPEKLTTIKDNRLLGDLANSSASSFAGQSLVAGLALDLSQTNLATLLEVLQKLPSVQSDKYYQGAKAIFERYPEIHQRYLGEFNKTIQDSASYASLILNMILPIYGSAQANLWMSVTNAFKNSSLESLARNNSKEELLQHLESLNLSDQEKNTIKESILQLHDDLILFFGEYIKDPNLQKKPVPIRFSNTQSPNLIFLNPNPSLIDLLGLDPDTYRKLSLGPASESFPEIRKLIANLGKAAYLKDSRNTIVISEAPKIGSTPDAYSVEMRDYVAGDPLNTIAHRASARADKTLVRSSNQTIDTGKPIHHYIVDLRFLEDSSAMQSLLKELEEKLHHKDHRNIRSNSKIELKFTLTLDGIIITSMDHNTLANAFSRIKHLKEGFGLRSNLEAFIAELKLLAEKRPQLIPDRLIKGVALSGDSQINFLSQERAIQSKHKNLAYFVVSGNKSFADNFQNSLNSISRIKANWLRS